LSTEGVDVDDELDEEIEDVQASDAFDAEFC
jgi:hypothetical protein